MADVFLEYLIAKKHKGGEMLLKLGVIVAAIAVIVIAFPLLTSFGLGSVAMLLAAGAVYGAYILITSFNVEFEYIITNGEMDIDKITAQRKRKRLITIKCKDFETFEKYEPVKHQGKTYQTKIIACDDEQGKDVWCVTLRHKTMGHTLVVFNVTQKMLEALKPFVPRLLLNGVNQGLLEFSKPVQNPQPE